VIPAPWPAHGAGEWPRRLPGHIFCPAVFLPLYGLLSGFCCQGKFSRCDVRFDLALRQPPGLGAKLPEPAAALVVFGNRAVEFPALARSRLSPFHARGCGAEMDPRHLPDAAPVVAAVIDADIKPGLGIGAINSIGPRLADRLDVSGSGRNSGDADLLFPAPDFFS
jgi:hypothetical protein